MFVIGQLNAVLLSEKMVSKTKMIFSAILESMACEIYIKEIMKTTGS